MAEIITSEIEIQSGVISSGLTVETGGVVTVLSGGTVTDAEAVNYGYFWVEEGGYISNIRITNSGDAMLNGGLAENLTIESGGMADIFGGAMRTGTILNGGYGAIYETGSGLDVAVSAGGRYLVYGGYAENTIISSGGSFTVQLGGGLADKTTIEAGGHARITSDGQMWETILNGGRLDVISGRILATTLNAGELHVSSGGPELASGYAENTVVNAGSFIVSGATATDTTVNGGAFIVSGGTAQKTTVKNGDFIASDAEVQSTTVSGGAVQFIGGTADKTDLFSGTVLVSGGTVQNTTLGSSTGGSIVIPIIGPTFTPFDPHNPIILNPINWDDIILVADGGTATITYGKGGSILLDGGATVYTPEQRETIGYTGYPGQTVNADELSAGEEELACRLDILNGGLAVSTTVNSGLMQVFEGGVANETTVNGGTFHVSSGGIANNITMSSGGGGGSFIVGGDTNTYGAGIISFNPVYGGGTPFVTVFEGGAANTVTVSGGLLTLSGGTANDVTLAGGTFHVSSGGIANKTTITGGMMSVLNGALANDATLTNGRIQVESGTIRGATVTGGTVRFLEGGTLAGPFTVTASADVYMESGSVIAFDITAMMPGAEAESSGLANIWGAPSFTLTVSDIQAAGIYALSAEAVGFRDTITVQNQFGEVLGTLTVGNTAFLNNQYYTLRVTDNVLNLTVANEAPARMWAPAIVFVNPEWSSLPEGSTVEPVAGLSATVGVDAFATGRDATNAVAGDGTVVVAGGDASFQYGITRDTAAWTGATVTGSTVLRNGALTLYAGSTGNDLTVTREGSLAVSGIARDIKVQKGGTLTVKSGGVCSDVDISASGTLIVEAGGYLTGTGKFASGSSITVNGTINFDLTGISAGNSALFACNNVNILGAPNFTITVSDLQATGEYSLADRISDLDGQFTILNALGEAIGTLTVGGGILIDGRAYVLRRNGTRISLTIASPEETNVLYVNTEWAGLEPDAVVEVPSGVAIIGFDAFGDLHAAEEHLTEDKFIFITGGTYASETISVGITMESGTITDSVITETGSLTLNNSSSAMNLTVDGALVMNSFAKASDLTVSGRLVMNGFSEAENITVTGNLVLNFSAKAKNLTAGEGAIIRGTDDAGLGGIITIGCGATFTGTAWFESTSELVIDGAWDFDISGRTSGSQALFRTSGGTVSFSGTAQLVITVSDTQEIGLYNLASGITGFEGAVFTVVSTTGATVTSLAAGESVKVGDMKYRLSYDAETAKLNLTVTDANANQQRTYVNSAWKNKAYGDLVQTPDGTVLFGINAFADLNVAQDFISEDGTVYVVGGTVGSGSITRNVQVSDAAISGVTVSGYGTLTLNDGATAKDIAVSAGSLLTVNEGATLTVTSSEFLNPDAFITIRGKLVLDISGIRPGGPAFVDASILPYGSPVNVEIMYSPSVSGLANGIYTIVSDMPEFTGFNLIQRNELGHVGRTISLTPDKPTNDSVSYMVTWSEEDPALRLIVRRYVNTAYVNPDWAGLENGTVVGGTIGYDSFATLEEAVFVNTDTMPGIIYILAPNGYSPVEGIRQRNIYLQQGVIENTTVKEKGMLTLMPGTTVKNLVVDGKLDVRTNDFHTENVIVNGTFSYQQSQGEYTPQDITITESGEMTGWAVFEEDSGIVINGTLDFKLGWFDESGFKYSKTQNGFLYRNLYNMKGDARYSVTLGTSNINQKFKLAAGVSGFENTTFTIRTSGGGAIGEVTLGVNQAVDDYVYTVFTEYDETIGEDCLFFTITRSGELALSSEWEGLEDGTVVQADGKSYTIGKTAFYDADTVMEKAYKVNKILIYSGSYSFSNGITAPVKAWNSADTSVDIHDTEIASSIELRHSFDKTMTGRSLTVRKGGSLKIYDNVRIESITVRSGGSLSMDGSSTSSFIGPGFSSEYKHTWLTGHCVFEEGSSVYLVNTVLEFDISEMAAGMDTALFEGFSCITTNAFYPEGAPSLLLTVSGTQEYGEYLLATGVADLWRAVSITVDGVLYGSVEAGTKSVADGKSFALKIQDGSLILSVAEYVQPSVVYLNSEWKKMQADTVVEVHGGTAVIDYDAFADMTKALSAAGSVAMVAITGGTFVFAAGMTSDLLLMNGAVHDSVVEKTLTVEAGASAWNLQVAAGATLTVEAGASAWNLQVAAGATLTVEAGGKLTGWAVFAEGANITVNGTLDFDISALTTGSAALYEGLSYVQGDTAYTLTVRAAQTPGFYYLAYGADGFKSAITLSATDGTALGTLRAGMSTRIGDALYTLNLGGDGILSLSIAPASSAANMRSDIDGNGVSDVLFQYTGGDNQTGYWMNGKDTWRSSNAPHPAEWTLLGAYDMDGDGIADSVFVGNGVEVDGVKGAYIGYYKGGVDTDDNWENIHFLENEEENVWLNKIGNLTGNPDKNSIVWHCAGLGALGVWTDGTSEWTSLGAGFDSNWTMIGCGDFNGDGRDSVVMSYLGGVKYYAIGLDGSAVDMGSLNWGGWEVRAIGDFKGDGKDDMVIFHKETGVIVMLADGCVDNYAVLGQLAADDWFVVGAGDYDGDKQDDLLVRQYSTGMLGYYTGGDTSKWNVLGYGVDMTWTVIA